MKKLIITLVSLAILIPSTVFSQDRRALRAAEMSFNSAESDYKKGNHKEAAQKFDIVVTTISASIDSRKHLEMRLESLIKLIDIHFYKSVNINQACEYLDMYNSTMNTVRNSGVLRPTDLLKYLKQQQEFANKEAGMCESYERVGEDMDKFKKTFEKEFE